MTLIQSMTSKIPRLFVKSTNFSEVIFIISLRLSDFFKKVESTAVPCEKIGHQSKIPFNEFKNAVLSSLVKGLLTFFLPPFFWTARSFLHIFQNFQLQKFFFYVALQQTTKVPRVLVSLLYQIISFFNFFKAFVPCHPHSRVNVVSIFKICLKNQVILDLDSKAFNTTRQSIGYKYFGSLVTLQTFLGVNFKYIST